MVTADPQHLLLRRGAVEAGVGEGLGRAGEEQALSWGPCVPPAQSLSSGHSGCHEKECRGHTERTCRPAEGPFLRPSTLGARRALSYIQGGEGLLGALGWGPGADTHPAGMHPAGCADSPWTHREVVWQPPMM